MQEYFKNVTAEDVAFWSIEVGLGFAALWMLRASYNSNNTTTCRSAVAGGLLTPLCGLAAAYKTCDQNKLPNKLVAAYNGAVCGSLFCGAAGFVYYAMQTPVLSPRQ